MKGARFLIDAAGIHDGTARLTGTELHHLRVRRLSPGDEVRLFDRQGIEYTGRIAHLGADAADIAIVAAARPERESPLRLTLALAVLKGANLDLVIEKTTELGVAAIVVFTCQRSVARPPATRRERWERIAASATKQCGRVALPEIVGPIEWERALDRIRSGQQPAMLLHPEGAAAPKFAAAPAALTMVVGPEGGFSAAEVDQAGAAGCSIIRLGPRILRAETAAITAVATSQALWGDLRSAPDQ